MFSKAHAAYVLHARKLGQTGAQYSTTATSCTKNFTLIPHQGFQLCHPVAKPFLRFFRLDQLRFTGQGGARLRGSLKLFTVFDYIPVFNILEYLELHALCAGDTVS